MIAPVDLSHTILETPRLTLRPWNEGDLEDLFAYASVDGVGEMDTLYQTQLGTTENSMLYILYNER